MASWHRGMEKGAEARRQEGRQEDRWSVISFQLSVTSNPSLWPSVFQSSLRSLQLCGEFSEEGTRHSPLGIRKGCGDAGARVGRRESLTLPENLKKNIPLGEPSGYILGADS